ADFIVTRNPVGMGIATRTDIRFGLYHHGTQSFCEGCSPTGNVNAIEVSVARQGTNSVDLLLAPMFGVNTHDVTARALTAQQQRAIMLVQDFSCSMNGPLGTGAIDVSREANFIFLAHLVNRPQEDDLLGLAGYAELGAMEGGGAATDMNDPPWARLSPLETELPYLTGQLAGVCNTDLGCPTDPATYTDPTVPYPLMTDIGACTNPSIAMEQAIDQLRDHTDATFFRGMVVMSDGVFNCGGGNTAANDAADLAWDDYDIHIWTILYTNGSVNITQMENMVRGVGFFQNSPSALDLPEMYERVAESLPTAIVD
ncbi:MAG: hypothetical protein KTR31_15250, partial [Myxococcales bacterium]|nr:hypothetical protein [Myxococcales bacterium]